MAVYIFCTPMGALRAKAADIGLQKLDNPPNLVIYVIEENVPRELQTRSSLPNWIIYRYGCFYFGKYYGWG